jgi:RNA polymerase sigma factor (sigma-70 family)
MASGQFGSVLRHIRQLIGPHTSDELTDGQLLDRFALRQDETAFEALMERHGGMVYNLCRGILHDPHSADDAFQATFLVLARKATSIHKRQSVASWLYGVAYRISLRAKANAARRRLHERQTVTMPTTEPVTDAGRQELRSVLNEELQRLPEKYRAPLVLCYLEGKTNEIAARELGWPSGSMSKRLNRGRELLKERLAGRGVALSAMAATAALAEGAASAAVPTPLMKSTLHAAILFGAGKATVATVASTQVLALADGLLRTMWLTKVKIVAAACLVIGLVSGGAGVLAFQHLGQRSSVEAKAPDQPVQIPEDPQTVVLQMDVRGGLHPAEGKEPLLTIRADGTAVFGNPQGDSRRLEMKLSRSELEDLLRFAVRQNEILACDTDKLDEAIRAEAARRGFPAGFRDAPTTTFRIRADGRDHEVHCAALSESLARQFADVPEVGRLRNLQQRLERLVTLMHAGGKEGVATSVKAANDQLRRQFPEAPPLTAADLQSAHQQADGRTELTFERRGVAADRDPFSFVYVRIDRPVQGEALITVRASLTSTVGSGSQAPPEKLYLDPINVTPQPIAADASVRYDYDIVYVRMPRKGDRDRPNLPDVNKPTHIDRGGDLMLLHPDGTEEQLVAGGSGCVVEPAVSLDGQWIYYALIHDIRDEHLRNPYGFHRGGSDIYKIHVKTRKIVRLTHQEATPNTGVAAWSKDSRTPEKDRATVSFGTLNLGPCPLPGGRLAFVSSRNALLAPKNRVPALQLFVMDDDGANVECIGYLNTNVALHPTLLIDGQILYTSQDAQGLRNQYLYGLWTINPDGSNAQSVLGGFQTLDPASFEQQAQLSDGSIVVAEGAHKGNFGFGTYLKFPARAPQGTPGFGPASITDPRNPPLRQGRYDNGRPLNRRLPFSPYGIESLTPFAKASNRAADPSVREHPESPAVGKVAHPAPAPDNHLLTVWSPGPVNAQDVAKYPMPDAGIYLIKSGKPVDEPGQMLLIKNDPGFNELWPRAVVPYKRIYGIDQPPLLAGTRNDGKLSTHLPEGTPFGLFGTSTLCKRESYPGGIVLPGTVTATFAGGGDITSGYRGLDPFNTTENGASLNLVNQGSDIGLYSNDDIVGVRILAIEPVTSRPNATRSFFSHGKDRLRIFGEIPVRKINGTLQPIDADGNPDTSFLVKLPANVPFTLQTIDKHGMALNLAQTTYQLRPGELRNNCGGCHAPSQRPTPFEFTAAAKADYQPFDLTKQTPLFTTKKHDQSNKKWDMADDVGLRFAKSVQSVEYQRDIKPILQRSCVACHTQKWDKPAGNLVLDDDTPQQATANGAAVPGSYFRLAADRGDEGAKFGHPPAIGAGWRQTNASRYIRMFQARRSLLVWKIFGKRTDGWSNDDFPYEAVPGDPESLQQMGQPVANTPANLNRSHLIYNGKAMPPPEAVAGTYIGPKGEAIKVAPLSDDDRLTFVRWIELGCPIDLEYDPANPAQRGPGWLLDDSRPTLTVAAPRVGVNEPLARLLVGMYDYGSGLDQNSLEVSADFPLDGIPAGQNLADKFRLKGDSVWEWKLATPLEGLERGTLTVTVKDKQGNRSRIERVFSVAPAK